MTLDLFPKKPAPTAAPAKDPELALPEPSLDAIEDAEDRKRPSRRGSRGGRGRSRTAGEVQADATDELEPVLDAAIEAAIEEDVPAVPAKRASRAKAPAKAKGEVLDEAATPLAVAEAIEAPVAPAPRSRRAPKTAATAEPVESTSGHLDASTAAILHAIEQQGHQIEQLTRLQEDLARRVGSNGHSPSGPVPKPARVGIFVDSANIELACDRLRTRFDWRKILNLLTQDRQLVRAIAYSPVHDDPGVSIETQRFVEPFLDRGYKVVTKPLKRFADGSIKANVDIELALDVIEMIDRLDVVVLISGDGDFQPMVELVQSKGVRVEVCAVGSSTASNLRHAADSYIDLQSRLREIRA